MFRKAGCFLLAAFLSFGVITTPVYAENESGNGETEEVQEREDSSESEQEETIEQEVYEENQQEEVSQDIGSESDEPETQVTDSDQPADSESLEQNEETEVNEADSPKDIKNEDVSEEITILGPKKKEEHHNLMTSETNEELLQQYLDHSFGVNKSTKKRGSQTAGNKLQGKEALLYNLLKSRIHDVAVGNSSSTYFSISLKDLGIDKNRWSANDLGVTTIVQNGSFTAEAQAAMAALVEVDVSSVVNCLMSDLPYDLYWFDKTSGYGFKPYNQISADNSSGEWEAYFIGEGYIQFTVAQEFKDSSGDYLVDSSVITGINNAIRNAQDIVSEHTDENDYQKLVSYKEEICEAVAYNTPAAQNDQTPYGNPWQLIWVFDGDNNTDVVCEGYSKAFKYLCDMSNFNHEISCILVTGTMNGGSGEGRHMWNIVTMEDGKRYLTDITNCDEGSVGADDYLFLKGVTLTGSDTYTKTIDKPGYQTKTIVYTYDEDTKNLWSANELTLSDSDYEYNQSYTLVLDANGGSFSDNRTTMTFTVDDGSVIDLSGYETPTRDNYTFLGWSDNAEDYSAVSQELTLTQDTTLYAFWEEASSGRYVTLHANEGVFSHGHETFVLLLVSDNISYEDLPTPERAGYEFDHWEDKNGNKFYSASVGPEGLDLYAMWKKTESDSKLMELDVMINIDATGGEQRYYFEPDETCDYQLTSYGREDAVIPIVNIYNSSNDLVISGASDLGETTNFDISFVLHNGERYCFCFDLDKSMPSAVEPYDVLLKKIYPYQCLIHGNGGVFSNGEEDISVPFTEGYLSLMEVEVPTRSGYKFTGWTDWNGYNYGEWDNVYYDSMNPNELYAQWEETPTITFDAGDGYFEVYDDNEGYVHKKTLEFNYDQWDWISETPCIPKHDTLAFKGWYEDENLTKKIDFESDGYSVEGSTTLYAKYDTPAKFTFDLNGGNIGGDTSAIEMNYAYGSRIILNQIMDPEREGYVFLGWSPDQTAEKGDSELNGKIVNTSTPTMYYAIWAQSVTITFDAGDGYFYKYEDGQGGYEYERVHTNYTYVGDEIWGQEEPQHDYLLFEGWYTDSDYTHKVDFDTKGYPVTEDATIYARYETPVLITFNLNGGYVYTDEYDEDWNQITSTEPLVVKGLIGQEVYPDSNPQRDGYSFKGWSSDMNAETGAWSVLITEDSPRIYYAVWSELVSVTYDANGGYYNYPDHTQFEMQYTKGDYIYLHDLLIWDEPLNSDPDLSFAGYAYDQQGTSMMHYYKLRGDVTFYATYNTIPEAVLDQEYHVSGENVSKWYKFVPAEEGYYTIRLINALDSDKITLRNSNKEERYDIWEQSNPYLEAGKTYYLQCADDSHNSYNLSFIISKAEKKTVTFDANGGYFDDPSITQMQQEFYAHDSFYGAFEPFNDNDGLILAGWSSTPDAEEPDIDYNTEITDDMTVYAVWKKKITIIFDAQEDGYFYHWTDEDGEDCYERTTTEVRSQGSHLNGTSQLPWPEYDYERFSFAGWYLDAGLTEEATADYVLTDDITLYAKYEKLIKVTFDAGEGWFYEDGSGKVTVETQYYTEGSEIGGGIFPNHDTKAFAGWYTDPDYTQIVDWEHQLVLTEDITLYAKWENGFTVTLINNNDGYFKWDGTKTKQLKVPENGRIVNASGSYYLGYGENPFDGTEKFFCGWSEEPDSDIFIDRNEYIVTKDVTLYAIWKDKVKITFHMNGGDYRDTYGINEMNLPLNETFSIDAGKGMYFADTWLANHEAHQGIVYPYGFTKEGHYLEGFYDNDMFEGDSIEDIDALFINKNTDIYVKWAEAWTVSLEAGDGHFGDDENLHTWVRMVKKGEPLGSVYVEYPLHDELVCDGYYLDPNFSPDSKIDIYGYTPESDVTLYAHYVEPIIVTFNFNGGHAFDGEETETTLKYAAGAHFDGNMVTSPEYDGKVFAGWSLSVNGDPIDWNYVIDSSITVYARWGNPVKVTLASAPHLKYEINEDGIVEQKEEYVFTADDSNSLNYYNLPAFIIDNEETYYVEGWYTDSSYSESSKIHFWSFVPESDVVLYPNVLERPDNTGYRLTVTVFENGEDEGRQYVVNGEQLYVNAQTNAYVIVRFDAIPVQSKLSEDPDLQVISGENNLELGYSGGDVSAAEYGYLLVNEEPIELKTSFGSDVKTIYINTPVEHHVESISLNKSELSLFVDEMEELIVTINPEDADNQEVSWSSSDETVAEVDGEGNVTALKEGTAVITATSADNSEIKAECLVTVNKKPVSVTDIKLDQIVLMITEEETTKLTATVEPEDADNKEVNWSSSDETVAIVDAEGNVTALKEGVTVITVMSAENADIKAECLVTVNKKQVFVTGISLDQDSLILEDNGTAKLTATVEPEDADNKKVIWSSSDETVATVDQTGKVTAKKAGTVVITAVSAENSEITAECAVTVIGAAVVEPVVDVPEDFDQETAEAIKSSEDSYGLAEDLKEMVTDPGQYIEEEDIENIGEESKLVIQTYVLIENLSIEEDGEDTILTLNITPMFRVVELSVNEEDDTEITGEPIREGPLEVTEEVEITIPVGTAVFGEEEKIVYIKHIKEDGSVYFYEGTYKDGIVTFVNPDGFSEFIISEEDPAEYKIGEERYASFEKAVQAVKDSETIWVSGKVKEEELTAEATEAKEFFVENNSEAAITINAAVGYEVSEESVDEKTVKYTVIKTIPQAEGVTRVYGAGRYQTSIQIAEELRGALGVEKFDAVVLASGTGFADALSGSYLSYIKQAPIILTTPGAAGDINGYIKDNLKAGGTVYVLGGTAAVPEECLKGLNGYKTKRLAGNTRYETSIEILKACGITDEEIIIANGQDFPDSLSASAAKRPILLVNGKGTSLLEVQKKYLESIGRRKYYIVGGPAAVSEGIMNEVEKYGETDRVAGGTRFDTSVEVAKKFVPEASGIVLAYSHNFPDGLCGGALAMAYNAPIILTRTGSESAAAKYAEETGLREGYALGGTGLISDEAIQKIFKLASAKEIIVKMREKIN